jgi:replicative DNA helicase
MSLYSINDSELLLGIMMNNPKYLFDSKYKLSKDDFKPFQAHFIMYIAIYNCANNGCDVITEVEVDQWLEKFPTEYEVFKDFNGLEWIRTVKQLAKTENIDYYYTKVRRWSLIRAYKENGYDIKEIFDESKSETEQITKLEQFSLQDIIDKFDIIQTNIKREFTNEDDDTTRKKAGNNGIEIFNNFKTNPSMGLSFESKYLTTLWNGFCKKQLYIRSGDTSSGKSRSCIGDLANVCANEIYDLKQQKWVENPNGKNRGLYLGCEMELDSEVDPLMWSYISGVESNLITKGKTTKEQDELVKRAISVVNDDSIWLTDMPSFNIRKLEEEIKIHKHECNIDFVAFDYMLLNNALVKEFIEDRGKSVGARGDEILLELSKALKDLCKKYDVGMITCTQVNADIKDYRNRDYSVIRGGKSIADKATGGSISMPITNQELKLVEPYIEKRGFGNRKPNFVETVYKARFSEYPKECKIFSYYDLGNMRKEELFVTDKDFKPINIEKTIINTR